METDKLINFIKSNNEQEYVFNDMDDLILDSLELEFQESDETIENRFLKNLVVDSELQTGLSLTPSQRDSVFIEIKRHFS